MEVLAKKLKGLANGRSNCTQACTVLPSGIVLFFSTDSVRTAFCKNIKDSKSSHTNIYTLMCVQLALTIVIDDVDNGGRI